MARFLAEVEGSRKPSHRLGSANSGIRAQAQGWDVGVKIQGAPKPLDPERDMFDIYVTGGSNDPSVQFKIGTVQVTASGQIAFRAHEDLDALVSV